ncbi:hypothetical protein ACF3NS_08470 [Arsenicicoccus cauae]|nr:hypothetical protein [Arsenicicoccus cauae]
MPFQTPELTRHDLDVVAEIQGVRLELSARPRLTDPYPDLLSH